MPSELPINDQQSIMMQGLEVLEYSSQLEWIDLKENSGLYAVY